MERTASIRLSSRRKGVDPIDDFRTNHRTEGKNSVFVAGARLSKCSREGGGRGVAMLFRLQDTTNVLVQRVFICDVLLLHVCYPPVYSRIFDQKPWQFERLSLSLQLNY